MVTQFLSGGGLESLMAAMMDNLDEQVTNIVMFISIAKILFEACNIINVNFLTTLNEANFRPLTVEIH